MSAGCGFSVAARHTSGDWVRNHASVSGFGADPGNGSSTASNRPSSAPPGSTATDAKDRIELAPGSKPSISMSVTT